MRLIILSNKGEIILTAIE